MNPLPVSVYNYNPAKECIVVGDESATCPYVIPSRDGSSVEITDDPNEYGAYRGLDVNTFDLEALIERLTAVRDKLLGDGHATAWSRNADGQGNCGAVHV